MGEVEDRLNGENEHRRCEWLNGGIIRLYPYDNK